MKERETAYYCHEFRLQNVRAGLSHFQAKSILFHLTLTTHTLMIALFIRNSKIG